MAESKQPKSAEQIRQALGGIAHTAAERGEQVGGGETILACSFRARETAQALQRQLRHANVPSSVKRGRGRFELWIDLGDREQAAPVVDQFRREHGDPPPIGQNHRDLLILSTCVGCVLGLAMSYELAWMRALPVVAALTGAGALLGFIGDYVVARAAQDRLRFGVMELLLLTAIVGVLMMLARQLPSWLQLT